MTYHLTLPADDPDTTYAVAVTTTHGEVDRVRWVSTYTAEGDCYEPRSDAEAWAFGRFVWLRHTEAILWRVEKAREDAA